MTGAVYYVHRGNGFFMNWSGQQPGEGFEYHILAIAMALVLVALGGGWASLDGLIARRLAAKTPTR
jgi:putative oxidoreductase